MHLLVVDIFQLHFSESYQTPLAVQFIYIYFFVIDVLQYMCQTLTYLNLSGNSLKDDMNNLYNFLAQPNVLKTLDLSATECAIDAVSYLLLFLRYNTLCSYFCFSIT